MSDGVAVWIRDFLRCRNLEVPDGRALYAYRCRRLEFEALTGTLKQSPPLANHTDNALIRAFVLYAAEWWQRRYDGRHWAWEPLLTSIGWYSVDYPELYEPVRKAWSWWKVDLVRLPTSIRYLGTFACQGGLPLALVGDTGSRVTQYLRAVLKHTAAYRQFVEDPIDLARDQQHLLRPPTLRRDYVFRLAADLIEAVLDLQSDARDEDPLNALDQARPDWRRTMPLDLEDERARDLLTGLLREAAQGQATPVNDFRVERFLRQTGIGWRLGARVRLPASVSADNLARQLRVPEAALPPRIEVRMQSERVIGLYAAQSDEFLLAPTARSSTEFWDSEAAGEVRLRFLAGGEVGEPLVPYRGTALGELPWAFRGDDDGSFIGEGSVSNRSPEIVVLVPEACRPDRLDASTESPSGQGGESAGEPETRVQDLERTLWRISEPTEIETSCGRCVIRPSSGQAAEEEYRLSGQRFYDFESTCPLFRGTPTLRVAKAEQVARAVPANEVGWRQAGGSWRQNPIGSGLWELRHVRGGELRYFGRAGILPERISLSIEPGSDMSRGHLVLNEADAARVAAHDAEAVVTTRIEGTTVRVRTAARDALTPPVRVQLRLHWPGAAELAVQAPFPGQGGRIQRDGRPVDGELAVDDLYGVRAIALSPDGSQRFWIEGELKAPDLGGLLRVAHFRRPLRISGVKHELPIVDVRPMIELLLAASSSSDASVALRIVDRYQREHGAVRVNRFVATLEYDPSMTFVSVSPMPDDETPTTFEALQIARPDLEPVPLDVVGPVDTPQGATLPQGLNVDESRLLVVGRNDRVRIRPVAIGGKSDSSDAFVGVRDAETPRLREAMDLSDFDSRTQAVSDAIDVMLAHDDTERGDEEWSFLTDSLLCAEGLPATALDLLKVLVTKPKLLVRCLFRLDSAPRNMLWRLEEELPFSWLLIRRDIWWTEAKLAFERLREQLSGVFDREHDRIAREHVASILDEGEVRNSALNTVSTDIAFRLEGGRLSHRIVDAARQERDRNLPEQIHLRANLDDWPTGDGRREWTQELEQGVLLDKLGMWQDPNEHPARQPFFDTPIAAAWCCFLSKPTARTIFLVKRIRTHDPEWFDIAYSAAWFRLARMVDDIRERQ